jgi:hypothetical protein
MNKTQGHRAWLALCFGSERQYGGNRGYEDRPESSYRFDSFVPYHKQVQVGDLLVLQTHSQVLGYARVEAIEQTPAEKVLLRCPVPSCRTTGIKSRKSKVPRYRCNQGHEFDEPESGLAPCTEYVASYGTTFKSEDGVIRPDSLRPAWASRSDQTAIRPLEFDRLVQLLPVVSRGVVEHLAAGDLLRASPLGVSDARSYLSGLTGLALQTLSGEDNRVLALEGDHVIVGTSRSPAGQRVPIAWVQDALDRLFAEGEVEITVESVGYRSAFIGAVLRSIPGTMFHTRPPRVALRQAGRSYE